MNNNNPHLILISKRCLKFPKHKIIFKLFSYSFEKVLINHMIYRVIKNK